MPSLPLPITDDSNDPSLASLPAWRSRKRGASSPQILDRLPDTDTDGQSNGCVSADLSFMHHKSSSSEASHPAVPQYLHGCRACTSDGLPDYCYCPRQPRARCCSAPRARVRRPARKQGWHAFLKAARRRTATSVRACIVLQTPLSPRRAMFRKESRGEPRHTIAETSNRDRWLRGVGFAVVRQPGSGPLSSHPARPMLGGMCVCVRGDQQ